MTDVLQNQYNPDYVSPPGETLLETLDTIIMSQAELARRMGRPTKTINEIIQAKAAITAETALQLEQVLGIPAAFWLKREQHYRESLARLANDQRLEGWTEWLKEIPIQVMMRRGWIPTRAAKTQQVVEALKFFGAASPDAWTAIWESTIVAYRKSATRESKFGALTTWLRQGEIEAQTVACAPYNADTFYSALTQIRALTVEPVDFFQNELIRLCADAGVAVVFVQELPKTGISGATQWLTPTKALIRLSLRYKTDDQLWFTFFHEAGHILQHGKRQVFLEVDHKNRKRFEDEADAFASNMLIDHVQWQQFIVENTYRTKVSISAFAKQVGVAPGIVVGRLQHENLLPYDHCNDLKRYLKWNIEEIPADI
jgi:HTH-type transcriptional regulator / antitoxin HigA